MRAITLALLLLSGILITEGAGQKPKIPTKAKPSTPIVEGEVGRTLDAIVLETDRAEGGFCGVVLVASKGKICLEKGYGIADAAAKTAMSHDALFDWASVTKQFTATAMLRLIDFSKLADEPRKKACGKKVADALKKWKKLDLEDPISRFFQEAPRDKAAVTLRQLLDHTSGIEAGFKNEWKFDSRDRASFTRCVLALPMTSEPGAKFDYSNSGYAFVAAIIEVVTGMTFEDFCVEHVFKPAGMTTGTMIGCQDLDLSRVPKIARGTGFTDRPKDFAFAYGNELTWGYRGCGGVVASTHDLFAWDRALRDGKFLSKTAVAELYRPTKGDYALGWEMKKAPGGLRAEHSGGVLGVVTYYMRHLELDYVVALACSYEPKTHPAQLAERLARVVAEK